MHRLLTSLPFCLVSQAHRICSRLLWRPETIATVAAIACICLGSTASAQPANNNFANAQVLINASGSALGSNLGASLETGEPVIAGIPGGASVWYRWTAPANLTVTFQTINSDFDTLLGCYTGNSVNALTLVGDNDDASGSLVTSAVTFSAAAGTTYYIAVDGFDGATGTIHLSWGLNPSSGDFRFSTGLHLFSEGEYFSTEF